MTQHPRIMRVAAFFLLPILVAACASIPSPMDRRAHADAIAAMHGWQAERITAGRFDLLAYLPHAIKADDTLTIYIEGDGFGWVTGSMPSSDPTPLDPLALRLALAQPVGNAAYLGRPCQYGDAERSGCPERYWTNARFAPEVIEAVGLAVDELKQRFGASRLILIGYSGGANVAALLAEHRHDVARLITVAGNLDHRSWTAYHQIDPLTGSLNAADEANRLKDMPQAHFIGGKDSVVPPDLARRWPTGFVGVGRSNLHLIQDYDHHCCWVDHWPDFLRQVQAPGI